MTDSSSADFPGPPDHPAQLPSSVTEGGHTIGRSVFFGPNGLRAGWRLLLFIVLLKILFSILHSAIGHISWTRELGSAQQAGVITAGALIFTEGLSVFVLLLCALLMSWIENRSFADYGMPGNQTLGKNFWKGVPYGFAMISLALALVGAMHGFSLGGLAISAKDAVTYGTLYAIGFLLVGIFEEFLFRGYVQATLSSGVGFWAAAIFLSILFGAIHLRNPGEAKSGAIMVAAFGLLAAFSLRRTGSIWFAIGMHAAWDWGETFFYSVPDSGLLAKGHLLNSSFHGPNWLTGGSVGPEGSVFAFMVLALAAAGIHLLFPAQQNQISKNP